MRIVVGGLDDRCVRDLLAFHVASARAQTAPGSAHALDLSGLQAPDITFWSARDDDKVLAVGALKQLSSHEGELKSMHTAIDQRRTGIGSAMLHHIVDAAKSRGMTRLSLETGSWAYFDAARAFYRKHGFTECGPFAGYVDDPNSVFMTVALNSR